MGLIYIVKKLLGIEVDDNINDIGCRAVKGKGKICGKDVMGQSNNGRIRYCHRHAPSDATPYGRIGTIEFYIPEEDKLVEKD